MHVVVVGAGAIGSVIAADLADQCFDVTLIARGARLQWLRDHPLTIWHDDILHHSEVRVAGWPDLTRPADLAVLCTKTGDLTEALASLAPFLVPGGTVLTLQNGVEAPAAAAVALPGATILAGRVHGFFELAGHNVRHVGVRPSIRLGFVSGAHPAAQNEAATLLTRTRFSIQVDDDIMTALWEKMLLTAALGGLAAAMDCAAGELCLRPQGEELLRQAMLEVGLVARDHGANLDAAAVERQLGFVREFPSDATTSLQRDLQGGAHSEYDALVGAVLRLAAQANLNVPRFRQIDAEIRARYPNSIST